MKQLPWHSPERSISLPATLKLNWVFKVIALIVKELKHQWGSDLWTIFSLIATDSINYFFSLVDWLSIHNTQISHPITTSGKQVIPRAQQWVFQPQQGQTSKIFRKNCQCKCQIDWLAKFTVGSSSNSVRGGSLRTLNYSNSGKVWTCANGLHIPDVQSENIYSVHLQKVIEKSKKIVTEFKFILVSALVFINV